MLIVRIRRYVEWSQQRNLNELWHSRDMPFDTVGTLQVQEFARAIYEKVLRIEDSILRGNKEVQGLCGLRVFARVDTALVWDDRDKDPMKHRYRLVLNEVQPGDASLFMIDHDCRTGIIRGLVEGIKRGSLEE